MALQNLPVRFVIDRAGLVGADGATHAGAFDIAFLACLPNMTLMAPSDEAELTHMIATMVAHDAGPIAVRFPRGSGVGVERPDRGEVLPIGKGRLVAGTGEGDVALLALGTRLGDCLKAAERLEAKGLKVSVADARFAKPVDRELVLGLARGHRALITVEEGTVGGFGSQVLQLLTDAGALDAGTVKVRAMVMPDLYIDQDTQEHQLAQAGLDTDAIVAKAEGLVATATAGQGLSKVG